MSVSAVLTNTGNWSESKTCYNNFFYLQYNQTTIDRYWRLRAKLSCPYIAKNEFDWHSSMQIWSNMLRLPFGCIILHWSYSFFFLISGLMSIYVYFRFCCNKLNFLYIFWLVFCNFIDLYLCHYAFQIFEGRIFIFIFISSVNICLCFSLLLCSVFLYITF